MKKSILEMTNEERKIYIKRKAINKVRNKINNKFRERMVIVNGN